MLRRIEGKRRKGQQRMEWSDCITDLMDRNLSKLRETVADRGVWHIAVHVAKSWTWLIEQQQLFDRFGKLNSVKTGISVTTQG